MKLSELQITQGGLRRALSQAMVNTVFALRDEFLRRGLPFDSFVATVCFAVVKEMSGGALAPSDDCFLHDVARGESGKFVGGIVEELCSREPDGGPCLDYNFDMLDGDRIEIRNATTNVLN